MRKLKLAILISGRGSNMTALIEACKGDDFPAEIVCVISNEPDAAGIDRARDEGLNTEIVHHRDFDNRDAFEDALVETLQGYEPDLVCLAGFMRLLKGSMFDAYPDRILNIHPSLLPAYKGLHVHERVVEAGESKSGCTVHIVVPEMDAGPILVQKSVPVLPDDTADQLAARVLEQEHVAYPEAIKIMADRLLK